MSKRSSSSKSSGSKSKFAASPQHSDSGDSDDDFDPQELLIVEEKLRQKAQANRVLVDSEESKTSNSHSSSHELQFVYNPAGLEAKLGEIALPPEWPWIEKLSVDTQDSLLSDEVHDDLKRESKFYSATLSAVRDAIQQLKANKIPYLRPTDYYAEMLKPDKQMARIKDALLTEHRRMEAVQDRKKHQEQRKFAKSVQNAKQVEKIKEKKQNIEAAGRIKSRNTGNNRDSIADQVEERSSLPGFNELKDARKQFQTEKKEKNFNKKRARRDEKFGYGGQKKFKKSNDSKSTSDFSNFSQKKNKRSFSGLSSEKPTNGGRRGDKPAAGGSRQSQNRNGNGSSFSAKGKSRPGNAARKQARSHK